MEHKMPNEASDINIPDYTKLYHEKADPKPKEPTSSHDIYNELKVLFVDNNPKLLPVLNDAWGKFVEKIRIYHGSHRDEDTEKLVLGHFKDIINVLTQLPPEIAKAKYKFEHLPQDQQLQLLQDRNSEINGVPILMLQRIIQNRQDENTTARLKTIYKDVLDWVFTTPPIPEQEEKPATQLEIELDKFMADLKTRYDNVTYNLNTTDGPRLVSLNKDYDTINLIAPNLIRTIISTGSAPKHANTILSTMSKNVGDYSKILTNLAIELLGDYYDGTTIATAVNKIVANPQSLDVFNELFNKYMTVGVVPGPNEAGKSYSFQKVLDIYNKDNARTNLKALVKVPGDNDKTIERVEFVNGLKQLYDKCQSLFSINVHSKSTGKDPDAAASEQAYLVLTKIANGLDLAPKIALDALTKDAKNSSVPNIILDLGQKARIVYTKFVQPALKHFENLGLKTSTVLSVPGHDVKEYNLAEKTLPPFEPLGEGFIQQLLPRSDSDEISEQWYSGQLHRSGDDIILVVGETEYIINNPDIIKDLGAKWEQLDVNAFGVVSDNTITISRVVDDKKTFDFEAEAIKAAHKLRGKNLDNVIKASENITGEVIKLNSDLVRDKKTLNKENAKKTISLLDDYLNSIVENLKTMKYTLSGMVAGLKNQNMSPFLTDETYDSICRIIYKLIKDEPTKIKLTFDETRQFVSAILATKNTDALDLFVYQSKNYENSAKSFISAAISTVNVERTIKWALEHLSIISKKYGVTPEINLSRLYIPEPEEDENDELGASIKHTYATYTLFGDKATKSILNVFLGLNKKEIYTEIKRNKLEERNAKKENKPLAARDAIFDFVSGKFPEWSKTHIDSILNSYGVDKIKECSDSIRKMLNDAKINLEEAEAKKTPPNELATIKSRYDSLRQHHDKIDRAIASSGLEESYDIIVDDVIRNSDILLPDIRVKAEPGQSGKRPSRLAANVLINAGDSPDHKKYVKDILKLLIIDTLGDKLGSYINILAATELNKSPDADIETIKLTLSELFPKLDEYAQNHIKNMKSINQNLAVDNSLYGIILDKLKNKEVSADSIISQHCHLHPNILYRQNERGNQIAIFTPGRTQDVSNKYLEELKDKLMMMAHVVASIYNIKDIETIRLKMHQILPEVPENEINNITLSSNDRTKNINKSNAGELLDTLKKDINTINSNIVRQQPDADVSVDDVDELSAEQRITSYPYELKISDTDLVISNRDQLTAPTLNIKFANIDKQYLADVCNEYMTANGSRKKVAFDEFGNKYNKQSTSTMFYYLSNSDVVHLVKSLRPATESADATPITKYGMIFGTLANNQENVQVTMPPLRDFNNILKNARPELGSDADEISQRGPAKLTDKSNMSGRLQQLHKNYEAAVASGDNKLASKISNDIHKLQQDIQSTENIESRFSKSLAKHPDYEKLRKSGMPISHIIDVLSAKQNR